MTRRTLAVLAALMALASAGCISVPVIPPDPCPPPQVGFVPNCRAPGEAPSLAPPDFGLVVSPPGAVVVEPEEYKELTLYVEHPPRFAGPVTVTSSAGQGLTVSVWPRTLLVPINKAQVYVGVEKGAAPGVRVVTITASGIVEGQIVQRTATVAVRTPRSFDHDGYALVEADGAVHTYGLPFRGQTTGSRAVGIATLPGERDGYWVLTEDGDVHRFGDAASLGSVKGLRLRAPVLDIAATPSGNGYWVLAGDGGVFSFGDARFHGSTGGMQLNEPVVAMAIAPRGDGYWLVARDGGIFSFGGARFYGSTGDRRLNSPIVDMATATVGYWLLAADGGVFTFGPTTPFHGSAVGVVDGDGAVALEAQASDNGYWIADAGGRVISLGGATWLGDGRGRQRGSSVVTGFDAYRPARS